MTPDPHAEAACPACAAPLGPRQRWCVACGTRQPGADPGTLLFGPATAPADAMTGRLVTYSEPERPLLDTTTRRRVALPLALASLAGLVAVVGTTVPASQAGTSQTPVAVVVAKPPAAEAAAVTAPTPAAPGPAADGTVAAPPATAAATPTPGPTTPPATAAVTPTAAPAAPAAATPESLPATTPAADPAREKATSEARERSAERAAAGDEQRSAAEPSPIRHVFVIALAGADLNLLAADARTAPYLAGTLVSSGTLLSGYAGDLTPAAPSAVLEQPWTAYLDPADGACEAGARAPWFGAPLDDCAAHVAPFAQLESDLGDPATTPGLSWIASGPRPDEPAAGTDGAAGTTVTPDAFLERVVPQIQRSRAYADGGLIVIVGGPVALEPAGALLISPFVAAGRRDERAADAATLLGTFGRIVGVETGRGADAEPQVAPLPVDVVP